MHPFPLGTEFAADEGKQLSANLGTRPPRIGIYGNGRGTGIAQSRCAHGGNASHRQHVYRVRMKNVPKCPRIEEILAELTQAEVLTSKVALDAR